MRIRAVFHPSVVCAQAADTLVRAATLMRAGGFGSLPVYDGDRMTGIFTERDLVAAVASEAKPQTEIVGDWMTTQLVMADPEEDSTLIAERMLSAGVRHLPVVEAGRLIGMISARDLLQVEAWPPASPQS